MALVGHDHTHHFYLLNNNGSSCCREQGKQFLWFRRTLQSTLFSHHHSLSNLILQPSLTTDSVGKKTQTQTTCILSHHRHHHLLRHFHVPLPTTTHSLFPFLPVCIETPTCATRVTLDRQVYHYHFDCEYLIVFSILFSSFDHQVIGNPGKGKEGYFLQAHTHTSPSPPNTTILIFFVSSFFFTPGNQVFPVLRIFPFLLSLIQFFDTIVVHTSKAIFHKHKTHTMTYKHNKKTTRKQISNKGHRVPHHVCAVHTACGIPMTAASSKGATTHKQTHTPTTPFSNIKKDQN